MAEIIFLTWEELIDAHGFQLRKYGGQDGFIDEGVVRSVMSRAQFTSQYVPDADLADLAADLMFGFATTQGFMDGNKRTALASASIFVRKNGWRFLVSEKLMYLVVISVARAELDRDGLAEILRTHMTPLVDEES